ncbi:MAG: bifunctional metallophosphatase/5'-nucleotidase [Chloroflexi bacterium]|nr:bifunctional metallophosphatase/5'-nucleotidase [Chloroflexota bacterium]
MQTGNSDPAGGIGRGPPLRTRSAFVLVCLLAFVAGCTASTPPPGGLEIASAAPAATTAAATGAGQPLAANKLLILHTNDLHGRLDAATVVTGGKPFEQGGLPMIGGMIARERARAPDRTLVLDAGDAWVGQLISGIDRGRSMVKAMSLIGYDAQALGNHDFDWGQDELAARAKEASFPFLTANVVEEATGRTPAFARPFIVKDLKIAKVAIIGLTYPSSTIIRAASVKGLRFEPAIDSVKKYLPEMKAQADVIVALSHLGIEGGSARLGGGDSALALAVPDIDLIIGGHDHLAFRTARSSGKTRIYQAGSNGDNVGRVEVTVDPATKKMSAVQGADVLLPVSTGAATPQPEVAKVVAERKAEAEKIGSKVIGKATGLFAQDREMNNPLGNVVADALLDYGVKQGWKTDIAFYNSAGTRAAVGEGDITYFKLAEVLPFQNSVVSVDLTGEQLKEVLEGMAGNAGRLFMSGGTMTYRFSNASSSRVLKAAVAGQPLDLKRVYHVATIDYLLGGGDGHTGFAKGTNVLYGELDVDVVAAYVQSKGTLSPVSPGRVTQE